MATSLTVMQIRINGIPTSPLEGKFDFGSGRFLTESEGGDNDRMEIDGEEQASLSVGTIIDSVFNSVPPTPGASTPGATTPIVSRFDFSAELQQELAKFNGQEDAFYSGLSQDKNYHLTDDMDIDSDESSNYGGSSNDDSSSATSVSTVPSSPGVFGKEIGHLRVVTDDMMVDSEMPDTPITDVSCLGFGTVVSINGATFSSQDAYHLRYLLNACRDLTNQTVMDLFRAVFAQDQWCELAINNNTTPYLVLANREADNTELSNGLRALHRLFLAKPTPQAMAKTVRQVRNCPSAADVDQITSVNWADMPLTDARKALYGLLMESSGNDYSDVPLSPSVERQMNLYSGDRDSSEYKYQEGVFYSEDYFLSQLGRDNLNHEDGKTVILAWLMLAQLTFSSKSWSEEFSRYLVQSPAYIHARASVLAEIYQVTRDIAPKDLVLQSVDLNALWDSWVAGENRPAPWKSQETWEWLATTPY